MDKLKQSQEDIPVQNKDAIEENDVL